jgi:hypothetical protein
MLEEGMATYLGEIRSSEGILAGFPEAVKAEWEPGVVPDYLVAMHFVGSLLARGTMDQYKALRRRVGYRATLAEFASTYEAIYGEELDLALEAMSKAAVSSVPGEACVDSDVLSWTEPDALLTTLAWQCGDGGTYGIDKAFAKVFALEISTMGDHDFAVTSPEPAAWGPLGELVGCPGIASTDLSSYRGGTSEGQLAPGRHTLKISMNPGPDMKGELHLELRREPSPW